MIAPCLQLNSAAFEDFCRQISYELGETYTQLIDLKELKFREKQKAVVAAGATTYAPKPAERTNYRKCVCCTHAVI